MALGDTGQRYSGSQGGLFSRKPPERLKLEDPLEKAQAGLRGASQSTASMTKDIRTPEAERTGGGAAASLLGGYAAGAELASMAGVATAGTEAAALLAAESAVTAGSGTVVTGVTGGMAAGSASSGVFASVGAALSNPVGWVVGAGMLAAYLWGDELF